MSLFYDFNASSVVERVKMKWPCEARTIPAGTPMSREGIANDGNAIGILAHTELMKFGPCNFAIITAGFVDRTRAEASFGEAYSDEAIAAMANINFISEEKPEIGGGASSWNDLTDRPFYTEGISYNTIFEGVVSFATSGKYIDDGSNALDFDVVDGRTYIVSFGDRGEYECIGHRKNIAIEGVVYDIQWIGNTAGGTALGDYAEDTGEPFCYTWIRADGMHGNLDTDQIYKSEDGELKIVEVIEIIETIPEKFLPDSVINNSPFFDIPLSTEVIEQAFEGVSEFEFTDITGVYDAVYAGKSIRLTLEAVGMGKGHFNSIMCTSMLMDGTKATQVSAQIAGTTIATLLFIEQ